MSLCRHTQINTCISFLYYKILISCLDVCIEAQDLELEMAGPNSTCLDGQGIVVWNPGSFFSWHSLHLGQPKYDTELTPSVLARMASTLHASPINPSRTSLTAVRPVALYIHTCLSLLPSPEHLRPHPLAPPTPGASRPLVWHWQPVPPPRRRPPSSPVLAKAAEHLVFSRSSKGWRRMPSAASAHSLTTKMTTTSSRSWTPSPSGQKLGRPPAAGRRRPLAPVLAAPGRQ